MSGMKLIKLRFGQNTEETSYLKAIIANAWEATGRLNMKNRNERDPHRKKSIQNQVEKMEDSITKLEEVLGLGPRFPL